MSEHQTQAELDEANDEEWQARMKEKMAHLDKFAKELSEANARNAMQQEALEIAKNGIKWYIENSPEANGCDDEALEQIEAAISASAESVSAWKAELLEPLRQAHNLAVQGELEQTHARYEAEEREGNLQKQVAMLTNAINDYLYPHNLSPTPNRMSSHSSLMTALKDTQATTEAFFAEHDAKVLEEAADWFESCPITASFAVRDILLQMAAELRAGRKEGE